MSIPTSKYRQKCAPPALPASPQRIRTPTINVRPPSPNPRSPPVHDRYELEPRNSDSHRHHTHIPKNKLRGESFELTMMRDKYVKAESIILDKDKIIMELTRKHIQQDQEHSAAMKKEHDEMQHTIDEQQMKINQLSAELARLRKEMQGDEHHHHRHESSDSSSDSEDDSCWVKHKKKIGVLHETYGGGGKPKGQLAARYGKDYKRPKKRQQVLNAAKAEAKEIAGCVAFAVNMNSGVEFYGSNAFGPGGHMDDSEQWDMYVLSGADLEIDASFEGKGSVGGKGGFGFGGKGGFGFGGGIEVDIEMPSVEVEVDISAGGNAGGKYAFREEMYQVFEIIDEDKAGMAPRIDLGYKVDEYIPRCPDAQQLSDMIRAMDAMVVDEPEYRALVDKWLDMPGGAGGASLDVDVDVDVEVDVEMPSVEVEVDVEMPSVEVDLEVDASFGL